MAPTELPEPSFGKLIITGGCGFLGSHIVDLVVKRNPSTQIHVLDLRTANNRHSSPAISYHDCDITDTAALGAVFSKIRPDAVIHTASPHFNLGKELHYKVNVEGTKNMIKAAQDAGVKAFVYTSSASVIYDPEHELCNADETWPLCAGDRQPEYYTSTKAWAETAVLSANRTPPTFLTCAIRPAGIIGEGDVQILPKMVTAFHKGQTKFQVGDNNNLFDFTYVTNIAHGHLLALTALLATHKMLPTIPLDSERVDGEAFFITNGQPVYFWDFARMVWHEAGDTLPLNKVWKLDAGFAHVVGGLLEWLFWVMGKTPNLTRQQVKYSTMKKYYSIDKAKRRLGYSPLVDLDEAIKRGVRFILEREVEERAKKGQ